MESRKKPEEKRERTPYTMGQWNYLIDDLVHPFFKDNEGLRFLDGFLHFVVKGNPDTSLKKFVKYNLPEVRRNITKKSRVQKKKCR